MVDEPRAHTDHSDADGDEAEHELLHGIARIDEVQVHVGPHESSGPGFHSGIKHHRS